MSPIVAILALAAGIIEAPIAPVAPPVELVVRQERLDLGLPALAVRLEVRPFDRRVVLHVPAARVAALARRLQRASLLCPDVSAAADAVILGCRTPRLRVALEGQGGEGHLTLRFLSVFSWRPEEEGQPLVPLDPALVDGDPCPGSSPAARGECLLAEGRLGEARAAFEEAVARGESSHAQLRLGDLDLLGDDPFAAMHHFRIARVEAPWGRLATARICELQPHCLDGPEREVIFSSNGVAPALKGDMVIRTIRHRALAGHLGAAARLVAAESGPEGACAPVLAWCRHVQLLALDRPAPEGAEALAAWLETPGRGEGPLALPLTRAAARQAEAAGAPAFAGHLLAAATGQVPPEEEPAHLLRTVRLLLAGGDRARAEEIARYAETHLPAAAWAGKDWTALRRDLRQAAAHPAAAGKDAAPADVASARSAVDAARLVLLQKQ